MKPRRRNKINIKSNVIDRAIEYVAPGIGWSRRQSRARLAITNSYIGASKKRRQTKEWDVSGGDADTDTLNDLPTLRERSRDLIRNNPIAGGAIHTNVTNIVGTGLRLQSRIDRDVLNISDDAADQWENKAEREWRLWAESPECDMARTLNFAAIQELCLRQTFENGDIFVLMPRKKRKNMPYNLRLQLIEADRVCNKNNARDTKELAGGIKKNGDGAPEEYHILKQHPGNFYVTGTKEWKKVPAYGKNTGLKNVIHLFRMLRPGQSRGVPYLAPVTEPLKMLDRYTEAEVTAAVISGMFTVFVKSESGEDGLGDMETSGDRSSEDEVKLAPGAIVDLGLDEDIETANPGRPNSAFDPFILSVLRQIGVGLELPLEVMIKHYTSSYTAARAAILDAWRYFLARRKWLADNFCQVVYEVWMYEAVVNGRLSAPGFFTDPILRKAYLGSEWVGPAPSQVDPAKEVNAAEKRLKLGLSTRARETAELTGQDYEKVHKQTIKEAKMRAEIPTPEGDNEAA